MKKQIIPNPKEVRSMNRQIKMAELREKIVELMRRHGFRDDEDIIVNRHKEGGTLIWTLWREIIDEADRGKPLPTAFLEDFEKELVCPAKEAWEAEKGREFFFKISTKDMTNADLQQCHRAMQGQANFRVALDC